MVIAINSEEILLASVLAILAAIGVWVVPRLWKLYLRRGVFRPLSPEDLGVIFGGNPDKEQKQGKVEPGRCGECNGLLSVNQPVVKVYALGNVGPLNFHADCLGKTQKGAYDLDAKKRGLRRVSLSKLWKYKGKPSVLHTRSPIIQVLNIGHPDGSLTRHVTFPLNMLEIKGPEKEKMRIRFFGEDKDQFIEGMKRSYDLIQGQKELQEICKKHLHHVVIWIRDGKQYYLKRKKNA